MDYVKAETNEGQKFTHDCDKCQFLGHYEGHDLWYCAPPGVTIIARWGSDGPDYCSGMVFGREDKIPELGEAFRRAEALGLDVSKDY